MGEIFASAVTNMQKGETTHTGGTNKERGNPESYAVKTRERGREIWKSPSSWLEGNKDRICGRELRRAEREISADLAKKIAAGKNAAPG